MAKNELSHLQKFVSGLTIIAEKTPDTDFCFEHDVMYIGNPSSFTEKEIETLKSLGFDIDEGLESFYYYS